MGTQSLGTWMHLVPLFLPSFLFNERSADCCRRFEELLDSTSSKPRGCSSGRERGSGRDRAEEERSQRRGSGQDQDAVDWERDVISENR